MILTRKEAFKKLRDDYSKADKEDLINQLMLNHGNMTDGELKSFLQYKYNEFCLIEPSRIKTE